MSRTDVELAGFATREEIFQRNDMRLREVGHVDVIADAGSIRGWIIVTEESDRLAGFDGTEQKWNQVRLGLVIFSGANFGIGAGCVEVTHQCSSFSTMTLDSPYAFTGAQGSDSGIGTRVGIP